MRPNGGSAGSGVSERVEAFLRDLRDDAQCLRRPNQIVRAHFATTSEEEERLSSTEDFQEVKGLDLGRRDGRTQSNTVFSAKASTSWKYSLLGKP